MTSPKLVQTTFGKVPIGGHFWGIGSREKYTRLSKDEIQSKEGVDRGKIWHWYDHDDVPVFVIKQPARAEGTRELAIEWLHGIVDIMVNYATHEMWLGNNYPNITDEDTCDDVAEWAKELVGQLADKKTKGRLE